MIFASPKRIPSKVIQAEIPEVSILRKKERMRVSLDSVQYSNPQENEEVSNESRIEEIK